jgi:hypothetical protein
VLVVAVMVEMPLVAMVVVVAVVHMVAVAHLDTVMVDTPTVVAVVSVQSVLFGEAVDHSLQLILVMYKGENK